MFTPNIKNEFVPETTGQMLMMHQFNAAWSAMESTIDMTDSDDAAGLAKFAQRFHDLISTPGGHPNDFFPYIKSGAFKECYDSYVPGYVIKFSVDAHQVRMEQALLKAAQDNGIEEAFLPTHFIDIHVPIFSTWIDPDDFSGHDYDLDDQPSGECLPLIAALIQPIVTPQSEHPYHVINTLPDEWEKFPIMGAHGNPLDIEHGIAAASAGIESLDWCQDYIRMNGDKSWNRLVRFIDDFNLTDLHEGNIGYRLTDAGDFPVILDWLSRDMWQPKAGEAGEQLTIEICG